LEYKVTISDGTVLEKSIQHVSYIVYPPDDYDIRRNYPRNSMVISGIIDIGEGTVGLYKWALIPGTNKECYKDVTVEHFYAGQLVSKVKFSKAFVVDYSESYSNSEGVGYFTIYLRQFAGMDIEHSNEISQEQQKKYQEQVQTNIEQTSELEKAEPKISSAVSLDNVNNVNSKPVMRITDRLKNQKDPDTLLTKEEEKLRYAKKIEASKEAYKRAIDMAKKKKVKGCVASNGKITLSGFDGKTTKAPEGFARVPLDTMFDYCKKIGHELPPKVPAFYDNGREGSYFACHAEKQLSLLTDEPIGISRDMCPDCVEYFKKHAAYTNQVKITADPKKTRIFFPDGRVEEF